MKRTPRTYDVEAATLARLIDADDHGWAADAIRAMFTVEKAEAMCRRVEAKGELAI